MKFFLFKTFTFSPRPLLTFVRDRAVYGALREIVEDFDMGGGLISFGMGNVFAICTATSNARAALDVSELRAF